MYVNVTYDETLQKTAVKKNLDKTWKKNCAEKPVKTIAYNKNVNDFASCDRKFRSPISEKSEISNLISCLHHPDKVRN